MAGAPGRARKRGGEEDNNRTALRRWDRRLEGGGRKYGREREGGEARNRPSYGSEEVIGDGRRSHGPCSTAFIDPIFSGPLIVLRFALLSLMLLSCRA